MTKPNPIEEIIAKASCFAEYFHDGKDGPVLERSCGCQRPEDCWEYQGLMKVELDNTARTILTALDNAGLAVESKGFIAAAHRMRDNMDGHWVHPEDMWIFDSAREASSPTDPDINGGAFPQEAKA